MTKSPCQHSTPVLYYLYLYMRLSLHRSTQNENKPFQSKSAKRIRPRSSVKEKGATSRCNVDNLTTIGRVPKLCGNHSKPSAIPLRRTISRKQKPIERTLIIEFDVMVNPTLKNVPLFSRCENPLLKPKTNRA